MKNAWKWFWLGKSSAANLIRSLTVIATTLSLAFAVEKLAVEPNLKPVIPVEHRADFFKAAAQWNASGAPLQQALIEKRKVMEADCAKNPAYQLGDGANGDPECVLKPKPAETKKK